MWTRDIGPSFVVTKEGRLAVANPSFNDWGYPNLNSKAGLKAEQNFDVNASKYFARMPIVGSKMNYEGGATIVNGSGVLITTESVMMNRNPKLTKTQIEEELKKTLGANNIIWLEQGVVEDDHSFKGRIKLADGRMVYTALTTGGHIDDFARFADASTILLAEVDKTELEKNDPVVIENNRRLEKSFKILSEATDQNGNPFKIVRVPMPKQMVATIRPGDSTYDYLSTLKYQDDHKFPKGGKPVEVILPASYLNFIIANDVVISHSFWKEGMPEEVKIRDEEAKKVLELAFPGRKVIPIDATAVLFGGGGIHCITMNQPAKK